MKKILAGRGMGKTTQLLYYAHNLALKNPENTIIFVTAHPFDMAKRYKELFANNRVLNVNFLSTSSFLGDPIMRGYHNYKLLIDDLDVVLSNLNIAGYSNTIGDINNEN